MMFVENSPTNVLAASSWEDYAWDLIRQRNQKHTEVWLSLIYLQALQKEKQLEQLNATDLDEIKMLLSNLQEDISLRSSKDFDDVKIQEDISLRSSKDFDDLKIRIDLERTTKGQKQLISDLKGESELLRTELGSTNELLAERTGDLEQTKAVVTLIQKELESSRDLLLATEDCLREVEKNNGIILAKLMEEKKKNAELQAELTKLQNSVSSMAANIIGGGLSFMKKNIFGATATTNDEDLGVKEIGEFVEIQVYGEGEDDEHGNGNGNDKKKGEEDDEGRKQLS